MVVLVLVVLSGCSGGRAPVELTVGATSTTSVVAAVSTSTTVATTTSTTTTTTTAPDPTTTVPPRISTVVAQGALVGAFRDLLPRYTPTAEDVELFIGYVTPADDLPLAAAGFVSQRYAAVIAAEVRAAEAAAQRRRMDCTMSALTGLLGDPNYRSSDDPACAGL